MTITLKYEKERWVIDTDDLENPQFTSNDTTRVSYDIIRLKAFLVDVHSDMDYRDVARRSFLGQIFRNRKYLGEFEPFDFSTNESIAALLLRMAEWLHQSEIKSGHRNFNELFASTYLRSCRDFDKAFYKQFKIYELSRNMGTWAAEQIEHYPFLERLSKPEFENLIKRLPKETWSPARKYELWYARSHRGPVTNIITIRRFNHRLNLILRIFPPTLPPELPPWTEADLVYESTPELPPTHPQFPSQYWTWARLRTSPSQNNSQNTPQNGAPNGSTNALSHFLILYQETQAALERSHTPHSHTPHSHTPHSTNGSTNALSPLLILYLETRAALEQILTHVRPWDEALLAVRPYEILMTIRKLRVVHERLATLFATKDPQGYYRPDPPRKYIGGFWSTMTEEEYYLRAAKQRAIAPNLGKWAWKYDSVVSLQQIAPILRQFQPAESFPLEMADFKVPLSQEQFPRPPLSWAVLLGWLHQEILTLYHGWIKGTRYPWHSKPDRLRYRNTIIWDLIRVFKDKGEIPPYWRGTLIHHQNSEQLDLIRKYYPAFYSKHNKELTKSGFHQKMKGFIR
ncbi:MAG: hypothetical protein ACTSVZ_13010 [Promethearchaeota archaeon]